MSCLHLSVPLAFSLLLGAPQDEAAVRKTVDEFKARVKDTKVVHEKAAAVLALAEITPRDRAYAKEIARFLSPSGNDINYVLPLAAADALARFRGEPLAAQILAAALNAWKRTPFVYNRLLVSLGRVGHPAALSVFEEILKGEDLETAERALKAVEDLPASTALEFLFAQQAAIDAEIKKNPRESRKKFLEAVTPKLVEPIQAISGEKYPTMKEMQIWWSRAGERFREKDAEREAARATAPPPPREPVPVLELRFNEAGPGATANTGSSSGRYPTATVTKSAPPFVATQVVGAGGRALDFSTQPTTYAVEIGGGRGIEHLKDLTSFTISGWLNVRILEEGGADKFAGAGNRVVSWVMNGKDGVEVVQRADGSLQLGINEWAEGSAARSQPGQLVAPDPQATNAFENNWRFFAVTYDGTAASGHVKWYIGNKNADAKAAGTADYARGPIGPKPCPIVTVGNAPPGPARGDGLRMFRGAIDELRIFGSAIDGSGALTLEQITAVQGRPKQEAAKK